MQKLVAFEPLPFPIEISAEVSGNHSQLTVSFHLQDLSSQILMSSRFFALEGAQAQREDGLWKKTCFEMFLKDPKSTQYYEFNFSTDGAWNLYEFKSERQPQPPMRSEAFGLQNLKWHSGKLIAVLQNRTKQTDWQISLTAVLQPRVGQNSYWALKHADHQPNFHHFESFIGRLKGV